MDSSVPYKEGGVLEAAKFAKGDGWSKPDAERNTKISIPNFDADTRLQLIEDLQNKRPISEIIAEYRFFQELVKDN